MGATATVVFGATVVPSALVTVCVSEPDFAPANLLSPLYDTLISWLPGVSDAVQIANPFASRSTVLSGLEPSLKVTDPVGVIFAPGTFTEVKKVTGPGRAGMISETMLISGAEEVGGGGCEHEAAVGKSRSTEAPIPITSEDIFCNRLTASRTGDGSDRHFR